MANTFSCRQCGFTAPVGSGQGWSLCPECGSDDVALTKAKARPAKTEARPIPGEGEEEE